MKNTKYMQVKYSWIREKYLILRSVQTIFG